MSDTNSIFIGPLHFSQPVTPIIYMLYCIYDIKYLNHYLTHNGQSYVSCKFISKQHVVIETKWGIMTSHNTHFHVVAEKSIFTLNYAALLLLHKPPALMGGWVVRPREVKEQMVCVATRQGLAEEDWWSLYKATSATQDILLPGNEALTSSWDLLPPSFLPPPLPPSHVGHLPKSLSTKTPSDLSLE